MKKNIKLVILLSLFISNPLFAVQYIYKDSRGHQFFECESPGYVGKAEVIQRNYGFQVFGPYFKGRIKDVDAKEAASIACGELRKRTEVEGDE